MNLLFIFVNGLGTVIVKQIASNGQQFCENHAIRATWIHFLETRIWLSECSCFSKFNLAWQLNCWDFKSTKPPIWSVFSQPECEQTNQHPWKRAAARRRDLHWCCFSRSFIGTVKSRASNVSHDLIGGGHLFPSTVYRLFPRWICEMFHLTSLSS